jgi:hypothetical protein
MENNNDGVQAIDCPRLMEPAKCPPRIRSIIAADNHTDLTPDTKTEKLSHLCLGRTRASADRNLAERGSLLCWPN